MIKKISVLAVFVFSFIWVSAAHAAKGYYDVPKTHWASGAVKEIVDDYQFMSGDPNGNFGGTRSLSRYEFAKTISNMIEYYNSEIESDRKDLENIVGVMELFQAELQTLQSKAQEADTQVSEQNQTIAELNEIVVAVADELANVDGDPQQIEEMAARLQLAEQKIDKLDNKGLFVGTLVKGVFNDVKTLGRGVRHVARRSRISRNKRRQEEVQAAALEEELIDEAASLPQAQPQVDEVAVLETHSAITGEAPAVPLQDPISDFERYQEEFDGLYADQAGSAPAAEHSHEAVEYLEPADY
ncbi:MAG: S-layer homology domain-containing protein [Candidatus Melainabacteria bacterium]|nr:S-layer homology domain-containing protein [Candidatus Melainabacteria bacterium]